ncbi:MAG: nucleotidyltransferase family protein [Devosia sp.]
MNLRGEIAHARHRLRSLTPTRARGKFPSLAWGWPTGRRDMLLRAAILADLNASADAYRQWESTTDFNDVDLPMMRLLVGISRRLPEGMLEAKDRARLNGIERKLWSECIVALQTTKPALAALQSAGIDVMIFKGAVRTVLDMSDLRGRYASELDLLVRPEKFVQAWNAILAAGWKYVLGFNPRLDWVIGANLAKTGSGELDLHRYPYHQLIDADLKPDGLWSRAIATTFLGYPVFIPSPTDRLMMAIAHGGIGAHEQSDWLVDAALLVRSGDVDWPLFEELANERGLESVAGVALGYLVSLDVPVPADVLGRLTRRSRFHPFRRMSAVLQARPKLEHSVTSAIGRGLARGFRMGNKSRMILRLERLAKR